MRKIRRTIDALPCDRRDMLAVLIVHLQRYFLYSYLTACDMSLRLIGLASSLGD